MSHSVHTTAAIVLSARNLGEANRLFTVLTREVGTVSATAQSIRMQKSKLRYSLQPLSRAEISLVRGRGGWRITNAYPEDNLYFEVREQQKRALIVKITGLLKQLLAGEVPDTKLFDLVSEGFSVLKILPGDELKFFELVFVSKILNQLGYGSDSPAFLGVSKRSLSIDDMEEINQPDQKLIVKEINAALRSSGL